MSYGHDGEKASSICFSVPTSKLANVFDLRDNLMAFCFPFQKLRSRKDGTTYHDTFPLVKYETWTRQIADVLNLLKLKDYHLSAEKISYSLWLF